MPGQPFTLRLPRLAARAAVVLAYAGAALALPTDALPAWRQASFDAAHTWFNRDETALSVSNVGGLVEVWEKQLGQFYIGATVQAYGGIFVCSNLHGLSALNAKSGKIVWDNTSLPGLDCGSPALRKTTVYVTTSSSSPQTGHLSAVDGRTGTTRWSVNSTETSSLGFTDPTIAGDAIYVADRRQSVYAFDAETGERLWRAQTPWMHNAATVAGGKVVLTTWNSCCAADTRSVYAFDAATGKLAWNTPTDGTNMQYPAAVSLGRVLTGSDSGYVRAFDLASGTLQWQTLLDGYVSAPLAAAGRTMLVSSANRTLSAIDVVNGSTIWTRSIAPWSIASNMVLANGVVYLTVNDPHVHRLVTIDAATGVVLPQTTPQSLTGSFAKLSVVDGRVQIATSQGWLHVHGRHR